MGPDTWREWLDVADERLADTRALASARSGSVGSVYLAGYAIECSLKALLQRRGRRFPTQGSAGHDLKALWNESGLTLSAIPGSDGTGTYYLESWSTDLRYAVSEAFPGNCENMVEGAGRMVGFLEGQISYRNGRRKGS